MLQERMRCIVFPNAPLNFLLMATLELTANGKVDRNALPEAPSSPVARVSALANLGGEKLPIVEQMSRVVMDVLKLDTLDPKTNILSVGANSIDIVRIVNAIERALHFRPTLIDVFRSPTIADLVRAYEGSQRQSQSAEAAPWELASASD